MSSQEFSSFLPASMSLENISSLLQAKIPLEEFSEQLPFNFANKTTVAAVALAGLVTYKVYEHYSSVVKVDTIGVPSGLFGGWIAAFRFYKHADAYIQEGYAKHKESGGFFKIASIPRYYVFPTNPKHLEELKNAPDDVLSFRDASSDQLAIEYTIHKLLRHEMYHIKIIQVNLTQRLSSILPDIVEEVTLAWQNNTNIGDEWSEINVWDVMLKVISQTANRMFVGLPLCRNQEFLDNLVKYATEVVKAGVIIDMTPQAFRWFVSWYTLDMQKTLGKLVGYLGPIFEERKRKLAELGDDWTDRPDDAIQWVLEGAPPGEASDTVQMVNMILFLNFAAIHTTSLSITHVLYDLSVHQELHVPLRDEIRSILAEEGGWTKQGLTKMKKLDSVLKESQRLHSVISAPLTRKAMVPFTFSDGTFIPKGTVLCAPGSAIHYDGLENPLEFDGFRYERLRKEEGQAAKHQMVTTSMEYLSFGHGRHACPGRFFATNELKVLLSNIMMNCEFKSKPGEKPKDTFFGINRMVNTTTNLLIRKNKA